MFQVNPALNFWLFVGVVVLAGLTFWMYRHHKRTSARDLAIRSFLDSADLLEADLQRCKEKMLQFADYVGQLPGEDTKAVQGALSNDKSVTTALKRVLSQRLWLRDNHESATLGELQQAANNLLQSRNSLAAHMNKLEHMRDQLERANEQLDDAQRTADRMKNLVLGGINHTIH
jgi:FtsZ-binding cell division protein ZapB